MTTPIHLGISTCPNDTFTFHGLIHREVDWRGLDFTVELIDIQQLNDRLFADEFDVAKTSFHAAVLLADRTVILPSGSALGFGVGPLLLSSAPDMAPQDASQLTLCPGKHTTATLLFKLFHPDSTRLEQVVFSDIMPRLQQRTADFGVCIHEGRFTWQDHGLGMVEDLGVLWESATELPLPLGGIVAHRRLPAEVIDRVQAVIADSLRFGLAHREQTLPTMRQYAQEFNDDVLWQHVDLYVNDWTLNLGDQGAAALHELSRRASEVGVAPPNATLEIFSSE